MALPRLHATAVGKGRLAKFSKINKRGVLNKVGEVGKKNGIINERGVSSIRNSRVESTMEQNLIIELEGKLYCTFVSLV